ncbi:MAG: DNA gyrase subunit A [Flavobacteriaceae bacterium]|jgi:DNA gyrase subunit A
MAKKNKDVTDKNNVYDEVVPVTISAEMKESYLAYAMSVITSRALPDIRDGLKPVHRRILFSMNGMGLTAGGRFRKSAAVVGDVLGKYHPHGDTAVYETMVGMAQDFVFRYPLVIGQGNFGSIDGDSAAAQRYTEAKMSKLSAELLRDLEKETVDFRPNYDATRKEPIVLPTAVPGLLLNGTLGIAVGMATNVPPHNLTEVMNAAIHLIENPDANTEDLLEFVKGPDFPVGGIAYNVKDIQQAYSTGRGGVVVRGEAEILENKTEQSDIIITSLPFRVNKSNFVEQIADLVREKKIVGIRDLRDESTTIDDMRVVVSLKSSAFPKKILNYIYKHTQLEQKFNYNMVALIDGVPQTVSLKVLLSEFIKHRKDVVKRRTEYDLRKAQERAHILEGLVKALDNIDEVIKTIKSSKDTNDARLNLMKKFKFSERQAQAILDMRLQKLAALERKALEDELKEKMKVIKALEDLLKSESKMREHIIEEWNHIRDTYGDARRTTIVKGGVKSISSEDLIPEKEAVLVFTKGGYIKRTDPIEYKTQRRGGKGVIDLATKEEDFVTKLLHASTHADLLFFSDSGKAYQIKMHEIPEGRRATKGKSIQNFISLSGEEDVTSIVALPKEIKEKDMSLVLITEQGVVKKMNAESFKDVRRSGLISISLKDGDRLYAASFVEEGDDIFIATKKGQGIRFAESDVREMGRTAGGVRGIKLSKDDKVVGFGIIKKALEKESHILVMTEHGLGKKTEVSAYKVQGRGGSGIKTVNLTAKTGELMIARVIAGDADELLAISKNGQVIRTELDSVPELGRSTQGVIIMKLKKDDSIASLTCL